MTDRQPTYPGRVQLIPVEGQENVYDIVMADEPTEVGTPPTKANLLSDATAALYGLDAVAVPNDVLNMLSTSTLSNEVMIDVTNNTNLPSLKSGVYGNGIYVVITSNNVAYWSDDMITFTPCSFTNNTTITGYSGFIPVHVTFGDDGYFYFVGDIYATTNRSGVAYSQDGKNFIVPNNGYISHYEDLIQCTWNFNALYACGDYFDGDYTYAAMFKYTRDTSLTRDFTSTTRATLSLISSIPNVSVFASMSTLYRCISKSASSGWIDSTVASGGVGVLINNGSSYFHVDDDSIVRQVTVSTEGIATAATIATLATSVFPAYGNSVFSGINPVSNLSLHSADGITWSSEIGPISGSTVPVTLFLNGKFYAHLGDSSYTLLTSTDGITYVHTRKVAQNWLTDVLGNILSVPAGQIFGSVNLASGVYTGTGTYGSSNKTSLTFDFLPTFILIETLPWTDGNVYYPGFLLMDVKNGQGYGIIFNSSTGQNIDGVTTISSSFSFIKVPVTVVSTTVSWYSASSAACQMNASSKSKYGYKAIG